MARLGGGTQSWTRCPVLFPPLSVASRSPRACPSVLLRSRPSRGKPRPWGTASPLLSCSEQLNERMAEEDQASCRAPVAPAVRAGLALQIKVLTPQKLIAASTRAPSAVASLASQPSPGR